MKNLLKILSCGILVQSTTSLNSVAATYPKPEISSLMFHVDKLPLDYDMIKMISRDLVTLASKNPNGNQKRLRANARLLAIAMRLDSKNDEARKLNQKFRNNESVNEPAGEVYLKARVRTNSLIRGLSKAEQYNEAHTLVDYLKDALKEISPNDVELQKHEVLRSRWENIVPKIATDTNKEKLAENTPRDVPAMPDKEKHEGENKLDETNGEDGEENVAKEDKQTPKNPTELAKWHSLAAKVKSPIYLTKKVADKKNHYLKQCAFNITIKPISDEEREIKVSISPDNDDDAAKRLAEKVRKFLDKKWKNYPSARISLELPGTYSERNGSAGVLPVILQVHASLKNSPLKKGVVILGSVDDSGNISKGKNFWRQLKELRLQTDLQQTLICPMDAESALFQLVALEEAEFFVRNEVILVNNIDEAVQFSSELRNEEFKLAHEEFAKIRDQVGGRSVGATSVDKRVRSTLQNIIALNPNHLSAKMILLRGDTKRSGKLTSYYVAEDFKPILRSLTYVVEKGDVQQLSSNDMKRRSVRIDDQLDTLKRYIDTDDKEIVSALEDMADELNNMSRALEKKDSDYHKRSARVAYERFLEHYDVAKDYIKRMQQPKD